MCILPTPNIISLKYDTFVTDDNLVSICEAQWKDDCYEIAHIANLENVTRNQAISPIWYEHRKGRITGTTSHDVLIRKESTYQNNNVMRIMVYGTKYLSKRAAIAWGSVMSLEIKSTM